MDEFVEKYVQKFNIKNESFDLDKDNLQTEEELAQSFYNLDEEHRKKMIKKIPLGILFRLKQFKNREKKKNQHGDVQIEYKEQNRKIDEGSTSNIVILGPLKLPKRQLKVNKFQSAMRQKSDPFDIFFI